MLQHNSRFTRRRGTATRTVAFAFMALLPLAASPADPDPRYAAVEALGQLNGIALPCKFLDQVRRMKAAVVEHAPKERSFGLAFDEATNAAFLAFVRGGEGCPSHDAFQREVGHRIDGMVDAFATGQ